MPIDQLGLSFLPTGQSDHTRSPGARLEDVIRRLSFRLPRLLGAHPIAPRELLTGQGGAGDPFGHVIAQGIVNSLLRGSPSQSFEDPGAPSPLSQLFAPMFGPGQINSPADLPAPPTLKIHAQEPPAPDPGGRPGPLHDMFSDIDRQLQRGQRRIV